MPICTKKSVFFVTLFPHQLKQGVCSPAKLSIKPPQKKILLKITWKTMKESNTLADNVANNSLRREIWQHIEKEYIKESNTLAVNANIEQLLGVILQNITGQYKKSGYTPKGRSQIPLQ